MSNTRTDATHNVGVNNNGETNGGAIGGTTGAGFVEFIALTALMTSLVALSIDAMLPALPQIGADLGVTGANDSQLVISTLFVGLAFGQLLYGPLSDSIGRKAAIYIGLVLFSAGCIIALFSDDFMTMLAGRLLQGVGVAGPRIVAIAMVRDQFSGRAMARVMSFIMSVFILVPIVAPALGQLIVDIANWRAIFTLFLVLAIFLSVWFWLRQPETLAKERRLPLSLAQLRLSLREILTHPTALGYTLVAGIVFGAFLGYLNSSQQIFQEQYALGSEFPLYFAMLAGAIGIASITNTYLVMRYGMRMLCILSLASIGALSSLYFGIALYFDGHPPLWALMSYLFPVFFGIGLLFGNLNALAMEPLGHIAGIGAGVVGFISTFISVPLGVLIGQLFNGTVLPLVGGFAVLAVLALCVIRWIDIRSSN
ncbi:MAG: multidrug effflux MFS transporter [Amphritea sp.]